MNSNIVTLRNQLTVNQQGDRRNLQKWNCIIQPSVNGSKSYGGLYLGDVDCAQDAHLLQQLKIGALLSVIDEPQIILPEFMNYVVRKTLAITDSAQEPLINYFPKCSNFIDIHCTHTNVLVHCFAGISRSATVVIAYLMEKQDQNFEQTFNQVRAVRGQVKPNYGFIQQLQLFENHLNQKKQFSLQRKIEQPSLRQATQSLDTDVGSKIQKQVYPIFNIQDLSTLETQITKRLLVLQERDERYKQQQMNRIIMENSKISYTHNHATGLDNKPMKIFYFSVN